MTKPLSAPSAAPAGEPRKGMRWSFAFQPDKNIVIPCEGEHDCPHANPPNEKHYHEPIRVAGDAVPRTPEPDKRLEELALRPDDRGNYTVSIGPQWNHAMHATTVPGYIVRALLDAEAVTAQLREELKPFKALNKYLPAGYEIGDDATVPLVIELAEREQEIAALRAEVAKLKSQG